MELVIICMKVRAEDKAVMIAAVKAEYYLNQSDFMRSAMRNLVVTEISDMTYLEKIVMNEVNMPEDPVKRKKMVSVSFKITLMDRRIIDYFVKTTGAFLTKSTLFRKAMNDEIELYKRRKTLDDKRFSQDV